MKIILLGPSGAGKGTLAESICRYLKVCHISTGIIFRQNIANKTELGVIAKKHTLEGSWVPDDITLNMLVEPLRTSSKKGGFVLDGYPRTLNQAVLLSHRFDIDLVVELAIDDEVVVKRLGGRYVCTKCEKNHNTGLGSIDKCSGCGAELYQRPDDKEETIRNRLKSYYNESEEMSGFYDGMGVLTKVEITEDMSPQDVFAKVKPYIYL